MSNPLANTGFKSSGMDRKCYEQLRDDENARLQLWFEVSSEMESHNKWNTLNEEAKKTIREILRYIMVEGWND
jgi:hypothetical protein